MGIAESMRGYAPYSRPPNAGGDLVLLLEETVLDIPYFLAPPGFFRLFMIVRLFGIRLVGPDVAILTTVIACSAGFCFDPCARVIPVLETEVPARNNPKAINDRCSSAIYPSCSISVMDPIGL